MNALTRALRAELLKLKRTLALWMVLIAPTVIVLLYTATVVDQMERFKEQGLNPWQPVVNSTTTLWALLMLPLFITLETALLANMEHGQKQWKHLFALPLPRWTVYMAKFIVAAGLMAAASLVLSLDMAGVGLALRKLLPGIGFERPVPWALIFSGPAKIYLLMLFALAIHIYVSLRWSSFTVAIGLGIVAVTISVVLINSDTWAPIYPWTLIVHGVGVFKDANLAQGLAESLLGCALITALGCWRITRRDVVE